MLADAELTIDELTEALAEEVGAWAVERCMPAFQDLWPRWRQAVDTAANRGRALLRPGRARKVTYTTPHRWSPGLAPAPAEAALPWLVRAYLSAYGPARPAHLARGSARRGRGRRACSRRWRPPAGSSPPVSSAGSSPGDTTFPDGRTAGAATAAVLRRVRGGLPSAGPASTPAAAAERALARSQAGNYPVLLLDGVVGGVWHQKRSGRQLDLTVEPLEPLSAARLRALDAEAERVAAFAGLAPRLTVGPVTVGAHA